LLGATFFFGDGATFEGGQVAILHTVRGATTVNISGTVVVSSSYKLEYGMTRVNVEGTLKLTRGGSSSGRLHLNGGTVIVEGTYVHENGGEITGSGTVDVSGANFTNNGTVGPDVTIIQ
jgi:hypothetical protein